MIVLLQGIVYEASPLSVVVLAGGVGYEVHIPVNVAGGLPTPGAEVSLHIRQVFREDASDLYGFLSKSDRDLFDLLIKVSGIGPKTGIALLSRVEPATLLHGIASGDIVMLSKCPGIGKKTAERIVVELRDKVGPLMVTTGSQSASSTAEGTPVEEEAIAALTTLGFKAPDARKAIEKAKVSLKAANPTTEELIKASLR